MTNRYSVTVCLKPSKDAEVLIYAQVVFKQDGRYWVNDEPDLMKNRYVDADFLDFDIDVLQGVDGSNYMPIYRYSKAVSIDSFHDEIEKQVKRFLIDSVLHGVDVDTLNKKFPNLNTYPVALGQGQPAEEFDVTKQISK